MVELEGELDPTAKMKSWNRVTKRFINREFKKEVVIISIITIIISIIFLTITILLYCHY